MSRYNYITDDLETGFHIKDGLFFKRLPDGSVRVTKTEVIPTRGGDFAVRTVFQTIIDSDGWASIIASVSAQGEETAEDFERAVAFHQDSAAGGER